MFADIVLSSAVREQRRGKAGIPSQAFDKLWARLNNRRIEFLQIDLELGLTIAQIAASAGSDTEKRERNTRNARKAYNTVVRFRDTIAPTGEQSRHITEKFRELHLALVNLGEPLQLVPMLV
jgi:hypothetical protein